MNQQVQTKKKKNRPKPEEYYVIFLVDRLTDEEKETLLKKGVKPQDFQMGAKIRMLAHNIEEEAMAIFVCEMISKNTDDHPHYTAHGNCLHEVVARMCPDCQRVILERFVNKMEGETGKKVNMVPGTEWDDGEIIWGTTKEMGSKNPELN